MTERNEKMTKKITWDIKCITPPLVLRYCTKCGQKTEYMSSGQFRVNAQRKYLDIWMIYKCKRCASTWNSTIYSRINSKNIDKQLLERFHTNDETLSKEYAMNTELLQQNGAEFQTPTYEIIGDDFPITESVELKIMSEFHITVKVSAILKRKLKISGSRLIKMIEDGMITAVPQQDLLKAKLKRDITILFV